MRQGVQDKGLVGGGGVDEKLTQQDQEGLAFKGGLPMRGGGGGGTCAGF